MSPKSAGNNHLVTSWRPCPAATSKQESASTLNSSRPTAGFSAEPAHAPGRTNASPKPGRRRQRVNVGDSERAPPATATSRQGRKPAQRRRGKPARRPWGAGPGTAATAPAATVPTPSRPRKNPSRDGRVGSKGRGRRGTPLEWGEHAGDPSGGRRSCRPSSSSPPPPPNAARRKGQSLGPTLLEQFLPTWTSLAAEAAWLCGSQAPARNERAGGGGGGGDGDFFGYGGGGGEPSGLLSGRVADHPGKASGGGTPTGEGGGTGAGKGASPGNPRQGSLGDERDLVGMPGSTEESRDDSVPAPSLHPNVERVLMGWIKSRIDR